MKFQTENNLLFVVAMALTTFLAGGGVVYWNLSTKMSTLYNDAEFLEKQLARLNESKKGESSKIHRNKTVRVEKAVREKLGTTRFFSGRLVEIQRATLAAETNGPIVSMPVEVGMKVEKDKTLIAEVDTIWARLAAEQAKKQIDVSEVNLAFHKTEKQRLEDLNARGTGFVSQSELDAQQLQIDELVANIALQKVVLEEAEKRLERSRVYAPFDGVIVEKKSEKGAYVSPGSALVDIVSTGQIDAEIKVSEAFIDRLKVGDPVPVWIQSLNQEVEGKIFSIVPVGPTAARSFPVRIRLDDENGRLKVGMSVNGRLQITDAKESISVVKDAVLDRPDGALVWVVLDKNEKGEPLPEGQYVVQPVQVVITARTETKYAVIPISEEGRNLLQPGADCVIEGAERLTPNESVTIVTVDPKMLIGLPKASGHTIIDPIDDNPFFEKPEEKSDSVNSQSEFDLHSQT
ncbi:MAG: efflux RND transporter periplasmic adaptor subunit [Planctomycetia bacterium]|nr:efflux RND transporter periplasmic adaptor subunit [Planctomycetia bacterium]